MPQLVDYLRSFVGQYSSKLPQLERELKEIEARKRDLERDLEAARLAADRSTSFTAGSGLTHFCPHCWVRDGAQGDLVGIPGGGRGFDKYRCDRCGYEYDVDA